LASSAVSKRKNSPYRSGRSLDWLKMKNPEAWAVKREADEDWSKKKWAITAAGKNRIMIFGSKTDGTYVIEFRTADGEALAISIPRTETAVIRHFQEMPYGLFVPDPP
jgi:hypothetical protein